MLTEEENIRMVKAKILHIVSESNKDRFVIIDGDRTIIPIDSTKHFFEYLHRNYTDLKSIFQKYGYSFEGFYHAANYYTQIHHELYLEACDISAKSVEIYPEFIAFIEDIKHSSEILLVTSGIYQNWVNIINNHSLDYMHVIGGSYLSHDQFIIDKNAKGIIARTLKEVQKLVFAFGDTLIDFDMLKESNYSYLVVNEKMNKDIIPFTNEIPHLSQVAFGDFFHPNLALTNLTDIAATIKL